MMRYILFLLLAGWLFSCGQTTSVTNKEVRIVYLFSPPDGEHFWRFLNHGDGDWRQAASLDEVARAVESEQPGEVYLRIVADHDAASLNNTYFDVVNSGPVELFVNGTLVQTVPVPGDTPRPCKVNPRRIENIGRNVYAFHFANAGEHSRFEVTLHQSPWVCTDTVTVRPPVQIGQMMRDAAACLGPDGYWYMTGTTGDDTFIKPGPNFWLLGEGITLFRSQDLHRWESLGYVWTFEKDGTWNRDYGTFGGRGPARGIFAPEIKYFDGRFWINYSVNHTTDKHQHGIGLLWADRPEGPYTEVSPEKPLTDGFDSNLFRDDDGQTYLLKHGGMIAPLSADISALAGEFRHLSCANYPEVGYEGVYLFKYRGRYYLTAADWNVHPDGTVSYDCMVAASDSLYGPYSDRYCAIRYGGHNSIFPGPDGELYATVWCYPDADPHWLRTSVVRMEQDAQGRFYPVPLD